MQIRLDHAEGPLVEFLYKTHLGKAKVKSLKSDIKFETAMSRFIYESEAQQKAINQVGDDDE